MAVVAPAGSAVSAKDGLSGVIVEVADHVEVEIAVSIGVCEGSRRAPAGEPQASVARRVLEAPVTPVEIQSIRTEVRDVEIRIAVPVDVRRHRALAVAPVSHPCGFGHVLERPIPQVSE
jgi:hypothetical protein